MIPRDVHYDTDRTNFYNTETGAGMGRSFFQQHYPNRAAFPQLRSGIIPTPEPARKHRWMTGPRAKPPGYFKLPPFPKIRGMWRHAPRGNGALLAAIMPSQARTTMGQGSISRAARRKAV